MWETLLFLLVIHFCCLTIPEDKLLTPKGNLKSNLYLLLPVLFRAREHHLEAYQNFYMKNKYEP